MPLSSTLVVGPERLSQRQDKISGSGKGQVTGYPAPSSGHIWHHMFLPFKSINLLFFSFLFLKCVCVCLCVCESLSCVQTSIVYFKTFFSCGRNMTAGLQAGGKLLIRDKILTSKKVSYYNDSKKKCSLSIYKIPWVKLLKWKDAVSIQLFKFNSLQVLAAAAAKSLQS